MAAELRRLNGFGLYGRTVAYDSVFQMKMTKALTSPLPVPIRRRYFRQLPPLVRRRPKVHSVKESNDNLDEKDKAEEEDGQQDYKNDYWGNPFCLRPLVTRDVLA